MLTRKSDGCAPETRNVIAKFWPRFHLKRGNAWKPATGKSRRRANKLVRIWGAATLVGLMMRVDAPRALFARSVRASLCQTKKSNPVKAQRCGWKSNRSCAHRESTTPRHATDFGGTVLFSECPGAQARTHGKLFSKKALPI